jgi:DNA cross-link repair 1A protein
MQELKLDHLIALQQKHRLRFHEIVAFRPTGWTFSRGNASLSTCQSDPSGAVRVYGIPYREHSSFAELCDFVRLLNPQSIIPTVNCHSERSVKKQVDALRQSAFHSIGSMFAPASATSTTAADAK